MSHYRGEYLYIKPGTWVYGKNLQFEDISEEAFENLGFDENPLPSTIKIHEAKLYRYGFPSQDLIEEWGSENCRELYCTNKEKQGAFWLTKLERIKMSDKLECPGCGNPIDFDGESIWSCDVCEWEVNNLSYIFPPKKEVA